MTPPTAVPPEDGGAWIAAIEGFYGPPLDHHARLEMIEWLPSAGFTAYAYGPKDDPYHRDEWRVPYPDEHLERFEETLDVARRAGIDLALSISPGLDWQPGQDEDALVAKLRQLYDIGVRTLGVYWDDVPPGGVDLGRAHGDAVAVAARGIPDDVTWMTVGVDYATDHLTSYLRGFAQALPPDVNVAWTGPAITSADVPAVVAEQLAEELGRPLLFADNWPVNDLGMAPVLHLGPAPWREAGLRDVVAGVGYNFMSRPLASRPGLELAARHWRDPGEDREQAWREVIATYPGLAALARSCRSWLTDPGPDPELLSWVEPAFEGDDRLLDYFAAGCRAGLPETWQRELEPWLDVWEQEAFVASFAIQVVRSPREQRAKALGIGDVWPRLQRAEHQVFGIRFAVYGLTYRDGDMVLPDPATVIRGENLTDTILRRALERLKADHAPFQSERRS